MVFGRVPNLARTNEQAGGNGINWMNIKFIDTLRNIAVARPPSECKVIRANAVHDLAKAFG
ncbi:MAG: hypothetical protein CFH10_01267 [Alphaproteobacteria bacterium MarineAlpha4_Bin2]|nr:MAG: hypothetical protein CFH10_01267 [Alphaproteobacteria bacterium MarineAlpha4_Bin2]